MVGSGGLCHWEFISMLCGYNIVYVPSAAANPTLITSHISGAVQRRSKTIVLPVSLHS